MQIFTKPFPASRWVLCCSLLLLLTFGYGFAQGIDGTLRGEVKDASGALVPNASVTVTNEGTGQTRSTVTTDFGVFNVPGLLPGLYTVTVELQGFKKHVHRGVDVKANQVSEVGVQLETGGVELTVEVQARSELVQITTSQLGGTFEARAVQDLPNPIVDPNNLAILAPGVATQSGGVTGYGGSIGGNRPRNNNFVTDGVDNNDISITGPLQTAIPEAVAEFTLLTNQFSAEYGHSTAGQFVITTQSGTNQLHGQAFAFLNNRKLNAFDPLDKKAFLQGDLTGKPRYDEVRTGATAGGPIRRDQLFLFGAFQYRTIGRASTPGSAISVPTAAGYSMLDALAASAATGVKSSMVGILKTYAPPATAQTASVNVLTEDGRTVAIPVGTVTPVAPDYESQYDFMINPDWVTDRHRVSGRFQYTRLRQPYIAPFPNPAFSAFFARDQRSVTFTDSWTISPTRINDFRAGYRRSVDGYPVPSLTPPAGLDVFPNFVIQNLNLELGPNGNLPQGSIQNNYQVLDTLTTSRGSHTFKAGGEFRWIISPGDFLPRSRGEYNHNTLSTFVKDYAPGNLGLRGVGSGFFAGNQRAFYGFVHDDWQVHPRVTLNLGLRYEWTSHARDAEKQTLNSISSAPGTPLIFDKPATDKNNWSPRAGFAWDLFGDRKTSIRGGGAIAYDVVFQNLTLLQLPPQLQQELDLDTACTIAPTPAYCATLDRSGLDDRGGRGFVAGGGIRPIPIPPVTQADARAATQGIILKNTAPTTYTWTLSVQRELAPDLAVETRYVGTRGLKLFVQRRLNARRGIEDIGQSLPTFFSRSEVPAVMSTAVTQASLTAQATRTYSSLGFQSNLTAFPPIGNSIYHGGSVEVTKRMSKGIMVRGSYTWSKTIDDSTNELFTSVVNPRRPQSHTNNRPERGLSAIHHEHHFVTSWVWDMPRLQSTILDRTIGGWSISGTYLAETGQPVTPLSFSDANLNGDTAGDRAIINPNGSGLTVTGFDRVCANAAGLTTIIAGTCPATNPNVVAYVAKNPTAKYVQAGPGTKTNSGRNILTTAGLNNWNLGLFKNFGITEDWKVQFRASMINVFNHRQPSLGLGSVEGFNDNAINGPGLVSVTEGNQDFMKPQNLFTGGNRAITLGLKLFF